MSNTPDIRFKGFTDPWEQRKLSELTTRIETGKSKFQLKENGEYEILGSTSVIGYDDSFDYEGDFLLTARVGANAGDLYRHSGKVKISDNTVFLQSDSIDFIYYVLVNFDIKKLSFGTGQPLVKASELREQSLLAPVSQTEKNQIGSCFKLLDNLITLHQHKCDEMSELKKYMLQKMFPKNGEQFPEIRFDGFTEPWEQRKLSDVAEIIGGGTPSTNKPEYWDGNIDWYAPAEINGQIYVDGSERKITKLGLEKSSARLLPAYRTVLFTSRAGIGKTAILRRSGTTNQGFQSIILNDDTNPYFVFSMTDMIKEKAERVASGSTFAEISGKMLGNLGFMFPEKLEQDRIGAYFESLDNLITLHQRKCDELKDFKKFMLQNMFPKKG